MGERGHTSWLRCHKFLSLLYIDFFVTGTGTLCFLAYSMASSLPVMSHSLQGATTLSAGLRAKNVSSNRTYKDKVGTKWVREIKI